MSAHGDIRQVVFGVIAQVTGQTATKIFPWNSNRVRPTTGNYYTYDIDINAVGQPHRRDPDNTGKYDVEQLYSIILTLNCYRSGAKGLISDFYTKLFTDVNQAYMRSKNIAHNGEPIFTDLTELEGTEIEERQQLELSMSFVHAYTDTISYIETINVGELNEPEEEED